MRIRHNMAYRAPASDDVMGMTKAQLKAAAAAGDAAAAAELERRKANAAERTQMGGEYRTEAQEKAYSAALAAGGTEVAALQAAGAPADAPHSMAIHRCTSRCRHESHSRLPNP